MNQPSDEIKARLDIVDVIRDYIPLKASGMNFSASCPFHNEKSASFMVSPDKQIWHCFGCGKGGDIFSFVMDLEGITFIEALRLLAPKAGVTLQAVNPETSSKRNKALDILELSAKYYNHILTNEKIAENARKYLAKRELSKKTIEDWQIGYSLDSWDNLFGFLKKRGFSEEEIFEAGMTTKKQNGQGYFDRFRGRIMFPISDVNGNVVAFTSRVSPEKEATEKMGKYINSPQTVIYDKSRILFGLDKSKQKIRQQDYAVVVEGQMDVITAHQNGFKNVIASSGTALSKEQLNLIKRYTKNIALAFDMDKAGELAAERAIKEGQIAEMNIKVIEVPNGKDPDDCIKNDIEGWKKAVGEAKHMMAYYIDKTFSKFDISDITERVKGINVVSKLLVNILNNIERDYWIKELSEKTDTKETDIKNELKKLQANVDDGNIDNFDTFEAPKREETREDKLIKMLLTLVLKFPDNIEHVMKNIETDFITDINHKTLYKNLALYYNKLNNLIGETSRDNSFSYSQFRDYLEKEADQNQPKILDELVILGDRDFFEYDNEKARAELIEIIKNIKQSYLSQRKKEIEKLIQELEKNNEGKDEIKGLMDEFKILSDESRELFK
ncbi:MAG: DNA primase [Patescibacteria group bacterium]|jgi:DNA primase|nr:DNA primase [Patescibacteria group bacterium]